MTEHPLVQRLREYNESRYDSGRGLLELIDRAADEIDLLTSKLEAIDKMAKNLGDALIARGNQLSNMTAERDRLMREIDDRRHLTSSIIEEKDRLTSALREATSREATLRAALERIANAKLPEHLIDTELLRVAREALGAK